MLNTYLKDLLFLVCLIIIIVSLATLLALVMVYFVDETNAILQKVADYLLQTYTK